MLDIKGREWTKEEIVELIEEKSNHSRTVNRWVDKCKQLEEENEELYLLNEHLTETIEIIRDALD